MDKQDKKTEQEAPQIDTAKLSEEDLKEVSGGQVPPRQSRPGAPKINTDSFSSAH